MINKLIILFLIFPLFFLTGCQKEKITFDPIFKLNISAEPTYLNPILFTDSASGDVVGLVFTGLLKVNPDLSLVPDLATAYSVSKDGLTYTFELRKNVLWHDGKPFTADDVIFTYEKILDPKTNTVRRSDYQINGKNIIFKKIDQYTVKAILPQPFSPFLVNCTMGIIPKHLLAKTDINLDDFNRHPVGTGPYKFVKWASNEYVLLTRNDQYYDKIPKIKEILLKIIPNENTSLIALKKGELDFTGIPVREITSLKKQYQNKINILNYLPLSYTYIGFNLKNPYFKEKKIRQAVAYAINKQALVKAVLQEYAEPSYVTESPASWAYPNLTKINKYAYNPAKSKEILNSLGYIYNLKTGYFEKNNQPFEFTLITNKGNFYREKSAQIIQQYLKNVGIKMNIQLLEWSSFIKIVNSPNDPKNFDAILLGWSLGIDPDSYNFWYSGEYPRGFNYVAYNNPVMDKLLTQERTEQNQAKRKQIFQKIYEILTEDLPYLPLYYPKAVVGVNNRVKGLAKPCPMGVLYKIEDVYLENETPR